MGAVLEPLCIDKLFIVYKTREICKNVINLEIIF